MSKSTMSTKSTTRTTPIIFRTATHPPSQVLLLLFLQLRRGSQYRNRFCHTTSDRNNLLQAALAFPVCSGFLRTGSRHFSKEHLTGLHASRLKIDDVYLQSWTHGASRKYWVVQKDGSLIRLVTGHGARRRLLSVWKREYIHLEMED
jgi:hypothetical protein